MKLEIISRKIHKTIKTPNPQYFILILTILFYSFSGFQKDIETSADTTPLEVSVTLRINKIYNINSVNETYQIDGYLLYSWIDKDAPFTPKDSLMQSIIYENARASELMQNELWVPAFELINVQGSEDTPNTRIEIYANGRIEYERRFFGTFSSDMDYIKFPFDSQQYLVEIEPFSYSNHHIIFTNPKLFLEDNADDYLGEDWEFISSDAHITTKKYKYMDAHVNSEKNSYSRVVFEIKAKRLSGYYQWQVLFPLLIIIMASFSIFWIKEFSSQIGVGFTLMLTVVAFNFYSASILPKLSYNTFIEYVIIVGYIFIFLGILAVIVNHRINGIEENEDRISLQKHFRYGFPLAYTIIMIYLYFRLIM
ncbi:hypothetical protein [Aquimarina sp. 2201CG14-23]|uniref:hypothetical protein n=1 Tax=Aquimarina mycalae TaxID=3040073 RepID=UPI002477FFA2|nr:hypothetical protein [Aquimarina sp. 2201CG14-23]MDH7447139.1 hypothetical protein [Aquimarina sp. 2201CG14-23]